MPPRRADRGGSGVDPELVAFGARVAAVRRLAGRSRGEVARRSGLGRTHIDKIEQGQNITLTTLFALARGLGVGPAELLVEAGDTEVAPP